MGHGGHILHINPRFSENAVIRNTETYGAWGGEERHGPFPFTRGGHFELMINIEHHKYHVYICAFRAKLERGNFFREYATNQSSNISDSN